MSYYDFPARFVPIVSWPGTPTRNRTKAKFNTPWGKTLALLKRELSHLTAKNILIQIDMAEDQIRLDGYPRAAAVARGPGVILTFDSRFGALSYPCDTFTAWEDNLRAIALALEALRTVDRYGVTKRGEQYTGWKKLGSGIQPAMTVVQAADYVGAAVGWRANAITADREIFRNAYRAAAARLHPDAGGSTDEFQRLQEAKRVLDTHHGLK